LQQLQNGVEISQKMHELVLKIQRYRQTNAMASLHELCHNYAGM